MSFLTGSAPKATFSTQSTTSPGQEKLLATLVDFLSDPSGFTRTIGGDLGNTSLASLEQQAIGVPQGVTGEQTAFNTKALSTLSKGLDFKADKVTAPVVDATSSFKKGVVEPLTDDFLSRTLPGITGQVGGSAGGVYGTGALAAREGAATDLERTLSQTGATYAYDAAKLNASSSLAAQTANQTGGINAQKDVLAALGLAPDTTTLGTTQLGKDISASTSTLAPFWQYIADLLGGGTAQTQQTLGVGTGGSTGLLGGLLGGVGNFAGSASGSSLISSLLSDRRVKEDIEEIGAVDGFPLYRFKYKGVPGKHVGVMAQDVERRLPEAVHTGPEGIKRVNYAAVLADVLGG